MSPLAPRTHLLTLAGSRAYGTHTDASDVDLLGVASPTPAQLLGVFSTFEQANRPKQLEPFRSTLRPQEQVAAEHTKLEGTIYALRKFLRLASEGNPNLLDVVFCRDADVRHVDALGETLRAERNLFLSDNCRHTFGGYAAGQLKRIQLHYAWHHHGPKAPPRREDYGLGPQPLMPKKQMEAAEAAVRKQLDQWELDLSGVAPAQRVALMNHLTDTLSQWHLASDASQWEAAARWVGLHDNLIEALRQERAWRSAQGEWKRYQGWKRNRNPARAALEATYGYDTKHASHLIRLLRMGVEVVTTGELHVWRGDRDADELLAIRGGAWTYERLLEEAQTAQQTLRSAPSVLPPRPPREAINELAVRLSLAGLKGQG